MYKWARALPLSYGSNKWHLSDLVKHETRVYNRESWRGGPLYIELPRYISTGCVFMVSDRIELASTESFGPLPLPRSGKTCGICLLKAKASPQLIEAQFDKVLLN